MTDSGDHVINKFEIKSVSLLVFLNVVIEETVNRTKRGNKATCMFDSLIFVVLKVVSRFIYLFLNPDNFLLSADLKYLSSSDTQSVVREWGNACLTL